MTRLPISGVHVGWRPADGHDDVALVESRPGLAGAVSHLNRVLQDAGGAPLDASALAVGDIDLAVVARRRDLRGDRLVAEGRCLHCDAAVDVQFSLAAYLEHHRPRLSRIATPVNGEPGWWRLRSGDVVFRVPLASDVLSVMTAERPRSELLARCVRGDVAPRPARAVEQAMATIAPTLRADVAGSCPACDASVLLDVDARELCLAELRFGATSVYDDVHLIASVYHWTEEVILDLASNRRRRYADLIAGRSGGLALPTAEVWVA